MDTAKKITLPQTAAALGELSLALSNLEAALDAKASEVKANEKKSLDEINRLQEEKNMLFAAAQQTISGVNSIMHNIDKVLENGSGNDHN